MPLRRVLLVRPIALVAGDELVAALVEGFLTCGGEQLRGPRFVALVERVTAGSSKARAAAAAFVRWRGVTSG